MKYLKLTIPTLILLLFFVLGILILKSAFSESQLIFFPQKVVTGQVHQIFYHSGASRGGTEITVVYTYDDETYTTNVTYSLPWSHYEVNQKVQVAVDPSNPKQAIVLDYTAQITLLSLLFILGLVFTMTPILIVITILYSRSLPNDS